MQLLVISALGISLTVLSVGLLHHAQYSMETAQMMYEQEQRKACMGGMAAYALSAWCTHQSMHPLDTSAWLADTLGGYRATCTFEQPNPQHLILAIKLTKSGKTQSARYEFELIHNDQINPKTFVQLKNVSYDVSPFEYINK